MLGVENMVLKVNKHFHIIGISVYMLQFGDFGSHMTSTCTYMHNHASAHSIENACFKFSVV